MESTTSKKLMRGETFIAGGVCAGLAKYYGRSKGGIQALFVLASLFSFGVVALIYILLWMIIPKEG